MAHLLGHRGCMESLRADLQDLQAAIADVTSRAGAVRCPSWKFPDKMSCDLDMALLLQRYKHSESEPEFSQHSHVVLLELLIDRLLLLLQSFTGYAEMVLCGRAVPPARGAGPCMSAGLTARRFWSTMLRLGAFCQQLQHQDKDCRKEVPTQQSPPRSPGSWGGSQPRAGPSLAQGTRSVPTQTSRCPLGSCDSCSSAQASLREVGRAISSLCQSQNIPSALSKFQEVLEDSAGRRRLSATDLSYWASEQRKDLSRINKHLQELLQQLNPVKAELEEVGKQKEELRKQVEDFSQKLQAEKENQAQQQRKAEQSLKAKDKEHSEAVARLEQDKDDLRRGAALLEERLSTLKEELEVKQAALQELELTKTTLLEEMKTTMVARSQMLELEEKVQMLTDQRDRLDRELSATSTELEKEKVRVQSVLLHEESLQAKQRLLLQQLDRLDREREELQNSLGEAEEDKARLEEQLEQSREQSQKQLQAQQELLDTLQQEKLALEQSILELQANTSRLEEQAQELRERERLLVFFPELHVPPEAQFESTGNLTEDMENQLQANSIRIGVLERENARLGAVLAKVKAAAQQGVLKLVPQAQLGSQLHGKASGQDTRCPSREGSSNSRDSRGMPGCMDKAWHRAPSSQHSKLLRAEPTFQARPCLSLPVGRLGLDLPCTARGPTTNKH
ncbi:coiled-coil domain-containing protein 157 isoform X2 [Empidonax traillii]|uniref:coiled-coil domain-containing protein 157 isoform X2 n=1 Tax=Empidonax traillii TaxID=164674 RepID=UPI000FFD3448|nr:coiled-coil domain-containing protein 157 isoform X2 [Empidonax traillii]